MSANENSQKKNMSQNKRRVVAMLLVLTFAVAAILYLVLASREDSREVVLGEQIYTNMPTTDSDINVGQVIDATANKNITPKEGYRYRVSIDGNSKDGSSGVTHIGGMVTFVPGTQEGDIAVIQITSVRRTVANAELISREKGKAVTKKSMVVPGVKASENEIIDLAKNPNAKIIKGGIYRGVVSDVGKKGDGIVKIDGKVTFIPGASKGETCVFKIIDKRARFNRGVIVKIEK